MRLLTFMEMDEIAELTKYNDERMNQAKERLAFEVTKLVHGEEKAIEAQKQAKAAFGGNVEDMPTFEANGLTNVIDIIAAAGIAKSKSEARRLIEGNAISVDDNKITVQEVELSDEVKAKGSFVLHKGKKVHVNVKL